MKRECKAIRPCGEGSRGALCHGSAASFEVANDFISLLNGKLSEIRGKDLATALFP
jgi:hypothetical protein